MWFILNFSTPFFKVFYFNLNYMNFYIFLKIILSTFCSLWNYSFIVRNKISKNLCYTYFINSVYYHFLNQPTIHKLIYTCSFLILCTLSWYRFIGWEKKFIAFWPNLHIFFNCIFSFTFSLFTNKKFSYYNWKCKDITNQVIVYC